MWTRAGLTGLVLNHSCKSFADDPQGGGGLTATWSRGCTVGGLFATWVWVWALPFLTLNNNFVLFRAVAKFSTALGWLSFGMELRWWRKDCISCWGCHSCSCCHGCSGCHRCSCCHSCSICHNCLGCHSIWSKAVQAVWVVQTTLLLV